MNLIAAAIISVCGVLLFAQFGRVVSAHHAAVWLVIIGFMLISAAFPDSLQSVSAFLGFELVSNFVLSALVFASVAGIFQMAVLHTRASRRLRQALCTEAAERFVERRAKVPSRVLVVCPCFNEEGALPDTLNRLEVLTVQDPTITFCIVNDGSIDGTARILRERVPSQHTRHLTNLGVSGALLTGFYAAQELGVDWVVQADSDGQHPIDEIPRLVRECEFGQFDLLIGSRFAGAGVSPELGSTTRSRWIGGRVIAAALRTFGPTIPISDPTSGFRVYSRKAIAALCRAMPDDYPEPESIAILSSMGLRIGETRVTMQARVAGTSSLAGNWRATKFMFKVLIALLGQRLRRFAMS